MRNIESVPVRGLVVLLLVAQALPFALQVLGLSGVDRLWGPLYPTKAAFLLWFLWVWRVGGVDVREVIPTRPPAPGAVLLAVAAVVTAALLWYGNLVLGLHAAARVFDVTGGRAAEWLIERWDAPAQDLSLSGVIATVVVAPVFEEVAYRGIILRRWVAKWGVVAGVVASSLLFALIHVVGVGSALIGGVIYAVLYLHTGTLWAPIAAHALRNGMVVAEAAWLPADPPWHLAAVARAPIESVIVGLGLVFAGIVGLLFIVHHVRGVLSSGGAPRAPTGTPNPRGYDG